MEFDEVSVGHASYRFRVEIKMKTIGSSETPVFRSKHVKKRRNAEEKEKRGLNPSYSGKN